MKSITKYFEKDQVLCWINRNIEKRRNTFISNLIKYVSFLANMFLLQKQNLKTNGSDIFGNLVNKFQ